MKNYYYNPKTRDLTIFDSDSKEILVLERIEGIRVLTSSEIDHPKNFSANDPADERANRERKVGRRRGVKHGASGRKQKVCSVCGKPGRRDKHGHDAGPHDSPELPEKEITNIAREERAQDNDAEGNNTE